MPFVQITLHADQLSADAKGCLIEKVTEAVVEAEGLGAVTRPAVWVVLNEIPPGNFAAGGNAVTLEDYEARMRAASAELRTS